MYLDKIHACQTGISLEISTSAIQALIEDAAAGERLFELVQIRRPEDICAHLLVTVYQGAEGLLERRRRWADKVKDDILAMKPVSYESFSNLFWRDIDEEDPDGDEWYRLIASEGFAAEVIALLDKVRAAQRTLRRSTDVLIQMNWGLLSGDINPMELPAF